MTAPAIRVGYKPAGGISKAKDALTYLALIKDELGDRWLQPDLFRFGASSLLGDIERQLEHHVTGRLFGRVSPCRALRCVMDCRNMNVLER